MYTCPKCGQEMIDKKEFCVKCGTKLKEDAKPSPLKYIFLIFGALIIIGIIVCYFIATYNTENDIKEFLPDKSTEEVKDEINENEEDEKETIIFPEG